jgi:hypothetical protein
MITSKKIFLYHEQSRRERKIPGTAAFAFRNSMLLARSIRLRSGDQVLRLLVLGSSGLQTKACTKGKHIPTNAIGACHQGDLGTGSSDMK